MGFDEKASTTFEPPPGLVRFVRHRRAQFVLGCQSLMPLRRPVSDPRGVAACDGSSHGLLRDCPLELAPWLLLLRNLALKQLDAVVVQLLLVAEQLLSL